MQQLKYIGFTITNAFTKRPIWISAVIYIFVMFCFLILIPVLTSLNVVHIWSNSTMTVLQSFLLFICAIFTAVLAIGIFRDTNEEGTELIIISKPISRMKIIFGKFIAFFIMCLILNLATCIIVCITLLLPSMQPTWFWSLLGSVFVGNVITFLVFGAIAILLCLIFNRIITILLNSLIITGLFVYQILTLFLFDTPLMLMLDDGMFPYTYVYRNYKDGDKSNEYDELEFVSFNYQFSTGSTNFFEAIQSYANMESYWEDYIKDKDVTDLLNATDVATQLGLTFSSAGLQTYSEDTARWNFGFSRFFDYFLTAPVSHENVNDQDEAINSSVKYLYGGAISTEETWFFPGKYDADNLATIADAFINPPWLPAKKEFYPKNTFIPAIWQMDEPVILGLITKQIPVAYYHKTNDHKDTYVYFEPDDYQKYSTGFEEIFNNVYNPYLKFQGTNVYDSSNLNDYQTYFIDGRPADYYIDLHNNWCEQWTTDNFFNYYNIAMANALLNFSNTESKFDNWVVNPEIDRTKNSGDYFEIGNDVNKLNERFLQYNYYLYNILLEQQDEYVQDYETIGRDINNVKKINWTGMFEEFDDWSNSMSNPATVPEIDAVKQSSYFINQINSVINGSTFGEYQNFLYTDINGSQGSYSVNRSTSTNRVRGEVFGSYFDYYFNTNLASLPQEFKDKIKENFVDNPVIEHLLNQITYIGWDYFNSSLAVYETNIKTPYYVYTLIWLSIAIALLGVGMILYSKYDIK